jgi:hypothetical protein
MSIRILCGLLIVGAFTGCAVVQPAGFRFLATGDVPYGPEEEASYRRLLEQSEQEDFEFLVHVGDLKAQSSPCSDEMFDNICDLFRAYPKPVVYTPGDNEWTDCHTVGADPIERLDELRERFFRDPTTLRLHELNAVHQSREARFAKYVENYRFSKSGVLIIVVHVVGSGNNHRVEDPPSLAEYRARNEANRAFLKESFQEAITLDAVGVAIVFHANPDFENGKQDGHKDFLATLHEFLSKYRKPVVAIHGDSHYFRVDKPFRSANWQRYLHFTRMEVFGSPEIAGTAISVDPRDPQVFRCRPYYLQEE